ncbi:WD repeat-containing protein 74 [Patella vulgata]|uniref:WD repeat-containing protein 74 n=1 Tax=Patella vulgata TaxID=6465 RepID=UPI0021800531|nr:WD repeat-containing protein 74 [Patella vulgata]
MAAPTFNVFVGSETGLLKAIDVNKSNWSNLNSVQSADRNKEICVICWDNQEQNRVSYGLRNREIGTYDTETQSHCKPIKFDGGKGTFKGLAKIDDNYITAVESGLVKVWNEESVISEFEAGEKLCFMTQNPDIKNIVATGGDENDLKIWDIEKSDQPIFMAKNVRNDWLNLRVPIKVLGAVFVPNSEEIVTCTGYHQVRLYDPRTSQRRPVVDMSFDEYPLMSIGMCYTQSNQVVVGNTQGKTALIDFRTGKTVHCFKGFAGSVRSIQCHPSLPIMATCGLDRFLRIHHIESRELLHKFYLKSRLNCLLLSKNWKLESLDEGIDMHEDDEENKFADHEEKSEDNEEVEEDVWDQLEVMSTSKNKTKKQISDGSDDHNKRDLRKTKRNAEKRTTRENTDSKTEIVKKKKK